MGCIRRLTGAAHGDGVLLCAISQLGQVSKLLFIEPSLLVFEQQFHFGVPPCIGLPIFEAVRFMGLTGSLKEWFNDDANIATQEIVPARSSQDDEAIAFSGKIGLEIEVSGSLAQGAIQCRHHMGCD